MRTIVHTPTNQLEQSRQFYEKLQYQAVPHAVATWYTDGAVIVEINPDRYARAGVRIFQPSWTSEVQALREKTAVHKMADGYLLNDLSGCYLYLTEGEFPYDVGTPGTVDTLTGNFAGLCLESSDIKRSTEIWQLLGFDIKMGDTESAMIGLEDRGGFGVSLMKPLSCPHLFFNPSMTYFNGADNLNLIDKIRATGIPITEEISYFNKEGIVDNIIIRDPGGYGFFIFSD